MTREQALVIAHTHMASSRGDWVIDENSVSFGKHPGNYNVPEEPVWIVRLRPTGMYLGATNVLVVRPDSGAVEWVRYGE
jgi:hypothetical protein